MSNVKLNNTCKKLLTIIPPSKSPETIVLKADLGASKTCIKPNEQHILTYAQAFCNKASVQLPNNTHLQQISTGQLPLNPSLSRQARQGHILKGLDNASLLSIGQICDDDCIAVYTTSKCYHTKGHNQAQYS